MAENQPEQQPEPAPDLMGYRSIEDLVAAKKASDTEAKRMHHELQGLRTEVQEIRQRVNPAPTQADPYGRLGEWGLPADDLRAAIQQEAQRYVVETLAPLTRGAEARNRVISRRPDFQKFEPEINRFLAENPEMNERYQRDMLTTPETAMDWAYLEFANAKRDSITTATTADDPAQAAIPTSQSGGSRANQGPTEDDFKKAIEYGQKFGNWVPLLKLKGVEHPELKGS